MKIASLPRKVVRGLALFGQGTARHRFRPHAVYSSLLPRTVHIWRGAPCNAKCVMCNYGYLKGEALKAISRSSFTDEMMPRALDQIHEFAAAARWFPTWAASRPPAAKSDPMGRAGRETGIGFSLHDQRLHHDRGNGAPFRRRRLVQHRRFAGIARSQNQRNHPSASQGTAKTIRCIELLLQARDRQKKHLSINVKTVLTEINLESSSKS